MVIRLLLWDGQDTAKQQQDLQRTEKWQQMGSRDLRGCDMSEQSVLIDMTEYVVPSQIGSKGNYGTLWSRTDYR